MDKKKKKKKHYLKAHRREKKNQVKTPVKMEILHAKTRNPSSTPDTKHLFVEKTRQQMSM